MLPTVREIGSSAAGMGDSAGMTIDCFQGTGEKLFAGCTLTLGHLPGAALELQPDFSGGQPPGSKKELHALKLGEVGELRERMPLDQDPLPPGKGSKRFLPRLARERALDLPGFGPRCRLDVDSGSLDAALERIQSLQLGLPSTPVVEVAVLRDCLEKPPKRILRVSGLRRIPATGPQAPFPKNRPHPLNVLVTSRVAAHTIPPQFEIQTPRIPALQFEQESFRIGGIGLQSAH
jgi:hypothetical protein